MTRASAGTPAGTPDRTPEAIVVGAGLGGLITATALARAGWGVTVIEAGARPGGWCQTTQREGYRLERGPQTYRAANNGAFARAVSWAGLEDERLAPAERAKKRFVLRRGGLYAVPRELPRVLGLGATARLLAEPLRARRARESESVLDFARRRLGPEAGRLLVDAFVSGVFAGDPARLELKSAFPALAKAEAEHGGLIRAAFAGGFAKREIGSFRRGMGSLTEALAEDLGESLHLRTRALALEPEGPGHAPGAPGALGGRGPRWRVTVSGPRGERSLVADHCVLAVPAWVAASLLQRVEADLALLLGGIRYAHVGVVSLGYPVGATAPEGFGFLAPRCEGRRLLGCIYASSLFPNAAPDHKTLLRVLLGGARDPAAVELSDATLADRARAELEAVLQIAEPPEFVHVERHRRAIPQYEIGHAARVRAIEGHVSDLPGLSLTGNAYRGVGVGDVAEDALATAEACLATALRS